MPILHWLNDEEARRAAGSVPYHLLEEVPELSYSHPSPPAPLPSGEGGGGEGENLLIQGDNLAALKALLPYYAGQVKCIFIDPPYNTGSAFEHYDDNLEHSTWLSLMYPRLELLRELLAENGSIWISIDDNEGHYLKVILDEIFGRSNFIANVVWQKKYAVANDHKTIAPMHDNILVFQKSDQWRRRRLPRTEEKDRQYRFEDERGVFRTSDYTCNKTAEERPNLYYPIRQPNTGEQIFPSRTRVWAYSYEEHLRHVDEKYIHWGKDGSAKTPSFKRYKSQLRHEGIVPQTLWFHEFAGHTDSSRKEIREILGTTSLADDFLTPKPEKLIQRVLEVASDPFDLVIDSFLGSGTTAAVAQKMGRRWIGIELGEHAVTHCVPRLRKVIDGEQGGISKSVNWQGGGGFRFFRLGQPIFDENGRIHPSVTFQALAAHVWFSETKTPLNLTPSTPPSRFGKGDGGIGPLLGIHNGTAYFLLYNGILGDHTPETGNVLTARLLRALPPHDGPRVIYSEVCLVELDRLREAGVIFKKIPYEVKAG